MVFPSRDVLGMDLAAQLYTPFEVKSTSSAARAASGYNGNRQTSDEIILDGSGDCEM